MEIGTQIKKYRNELKLSQEELAEKVFVTRQTISNWETEKNYPDIHSVLLLSSIFNISLDQLIKGDIEIMKKEILSKRFLAVSIFGWIKVYNYDKLEFLEEQAWQRMLWFLFF